MLLAVSTNSKACFI